MRGARACDTHDIHANCTYCPRSSSYSREGVHHVRVASRDDVGSLGQGLVPKHRSVFDNRRVWVEYYFWTLRYSKGTAYLAHFFLATHNYIQQSKGQHLVTV